MSGDAVKHVRVSIKAIIIEEGRLLAIRCGVGPEACYELPGGGQQSGETVPEALHRECLEEIGRDVIVGRLRFVRDYIADHHEFADKEPGVTQVELMFECRLASPVLGADDADRASRPELRMGSVPDTWQTGVAWLDLRDHAAPRFYPRALWRRLVAGETGGEPVYLGDVN